MLSVCASSHVLPLCDLKDCRPPGLNPSLLCLLHWQVDSLPLIFSNGSVVKSPPSGNAVDASSIPGLGRSPGGGHGNPLHCSCLENPVDRGAWQATVHGVTKSQTQLKWQHPCTHTYNLSYSNYASIKRESLYLFFSTRNSIFSSCCKKRLQVNEALSFNGFRSSFQDKKSSADTR